MNPARSHLQDALNAHLQTDTPNISEFQTEISYAESKLPIDAPEDYQKAFSTFVSLTTILTKRNPSDAHITEFVKLADELATMNETANTTDFQNRARWLLAELPTRDATPTRPDEDSAWGVVAEAYLEPEQ